jgi:hypothetical protein
MWLWLSHHSHLLLLLHIRPCTGGWILCLQLRHRHFFVFLGVSYFCSEDPTTIPACLVLFETSLKQVGMLLFIDRVSTAGVGSTFWLRKNFIRGSWRVYHVLVLIHHNLLFVFFKWTKLSHLRLPLLLALLLLLELSCYHFPLGLLLLSFVIGLLLL